MKANGVTVAAANLGKERTVHKKGVGDFCYEAFTFTEVPGGKTLYEVVINVSNNTSLTINGCSGTVCEKPAQLGKPLNLTCS